MLACASLRVVAQLKGDHACLWIPSVAGLRGVGLVEIVNTCGSPAWQALGAQPNGAEIVQACAGMMFTAQWRGEHVCLWITGLADLRGTVVRDHMGLRGESLGECSPGGAEEWAQRSEIPWPEGQQLCSLWGGAWHVALAVLS
jgi:hypothetical protein